MASNKATMASVWACTTAIAAVTLAPPAMATNSRAELEIVKQRVLEWMPGEYDSSPQIDLEQRYGAPPDGEHEDWYRMFAIIDAPQIGENVIYGELRIGGPDGPLVKGTQVVYNVRIDEATGTVFANGRRIRNPDQFLGAHLDPAKQRAIEIDPNYGGNCDFRWKLHGDQVHGLLGHDGTCSMTSKISGNKMSFDAEWVLTPDQLWIFDNNYIEGQGLFMGREDRTHIRLYKVRRFSCTAGGQALTLHDRGDRKPIKVGGQARQLELLRGYRTVGAAQRLTEVTSIRVLGEDGKSVVAEAMSTGVADAMVLTAPGLDVSCALQPAGR